MRQELHATEGLLPLESSCPAHATRCTVAEYTGSGSASSKTSRARDATLKGSGEMARVCASAACCTRAPSPLEKGSRASANGPLSGRISVTWHRCSHKEVQLEAREAPQGAPLGTHAMMRTVRHEEATDRPHQRHFTLTHTQKPAFGPGSQHRVFPRCMRAIPHGRNASTATPRLPVFLKPYGAQCYHEMGRGLVKHPLGALAHVLAFVSRKLSMVQCRHPDQGISPALLPGGQHQRAHLAEELRRAHGADERAAAVLACNHSLVQRGLVPPCLRGALVGARCLDGWQLCGWPRPMGLLGACAGPPPCGRLRARPEALAAAAQVARQG